LVKLCNEVLPFMIGARRVRRQWFVVLAKVHAYGGELATALAGLGVGAPVVALFQGKAPGGQSALDALRQALPGVWFWIGIVALALWLILRLVVKQQNVLDRALFARECSKTMQKLGADLYDALSDPNPMPKIIATQEAQRRAVREAIDKDVWPWNPQWPNAEDIALELRKEVNDIRDRFMRQWAPPTGGI
jgi:hypothetical protein